MYTLITISVLIWLFLSYDAIKSKDEDNIVLIIVIPIVSVILTALIYLIITYLP